jgi:hypothetical protein
VDSYVLRTDPEQYSPVPGGAPFHCNCRLCAFEQSAVGWSELKVSEFLRCKKLTDACTSSYFRRMPGVEEGDRFQTGTRLEPHLSFEVFNISFHLLSL